MVFSGTVVNAVAGNRGLATAATCSSANAMSASEIRVSPIRTRGSIPEAVTPGRLSPGTHGFGSRTRTTASPNVDVRFNIGIQQAANHSLVLSLGLGGLRLEELHALPAQGNRDLYVLVAKREFGRRR
jgi:hypothetical protein